jgi:hypothetical protein
MPRYGKVLNLRIQFQIFSSEDFTLNLKSLATNMRSAAFFR